MIEKIYKKVPITYLKQYEFNPRIHPKKNIDAIKKSLKSFNQYKPLIVDAETNSILAGNGTFQSALELGFTEIECIFISGLSEEQKNIIVIADNKLNESSKWIYETLEKIDIIPDFSEDYESLIKSIIPNKSKKESSEEKKEDKVCKFCNNKLKIIEIDSKKIKK
jgi:ParB-like chromosome segregation protein Spo0J